MQCPVFRFCFGVSLVVTVVNMDVDTVRENLLEQLQLLKDVRPSGDL